MIHITLPDGSVKEFESGVTAFDVAEAISPRLRKAVLAAEIDGERHDAFAPIDHDCSLKLLTFNDEDGRWTLRHTASHVLAQAVKKVKPGAKLAIGPAIDNGFYYDFDVDEPFTPDDLVLIEKEMAKIVEEKLPLERFELPREEAIKFMAERGEPYKVELIEDLPEDAVISFYKQGDFVDLCAGPHVENTGKVKNFKLMSIAGAYWRGSEKNKMLQRIYGTAFEKKSDLDEYITRIEEAKKRDHRKIGRELGLFTIMDEGPGFPFFLPKGMVLRNTLIDYWREVHKRYGYVEISTPIILNRTLWERSGHWGHYKNNMYTTVIDDEDFAIKPMNCPGGMLVYKLEPHSYRELPLRCGELGLVHRHELSGALHGLFRVRCFTQDDAHIFMTREQMKDEIKGVAKLFDEVYSLFGLKYTIELSTMPEDHIGTEEEWIENQEILKAAITEMGKEFVRLFAGCEVNKILTIEASGIGIACIAAQQFGCPVVFAKKNKTKNIAGDVWTSRVESFTHGKVYDIIVSKDYLTPADRVLIIDDFLAMGSALQGLIKLVEDSGASLAGAGIAVEKAFQPGGELIRSMGVRVESLARIESMDPETGVHFVGE